MLIGIARPLIIVAAGLWVAGCTTSSSFSNLFGPKTPGAEASASAQVDETTEPHLTVDGSAPVEPVDESTGSVTGSAGKKTAPGLLGSDPYDELSLGKKHIAPIISVSPRSTSAWRSKSIRAMQKPGWALRRLMIVCAASISPTAPTPRPSASSDPRSKFSTTKATHTCC